MGKVSKPKKQEVSTGVIDFTKDAGKGMEEADKSSFAIPFLIVLQPMSPQIETISGAKAGLILNSITNELYKEALVIPCAFQRRYIRWAPRSNGGGYKGELNPVDVETGKVPNLTDIDGYYMFDVPSDGAAFDKEGKPKYDFLSDTRNHFVLVQNHQGGWSQALMSLSSTQIKKSKKWMSRIQGIELLDSKKKPFNPPSFSHIYSVKTIKEENSKGAWHGLEIELVRQVDEPEVYQAALRFNESVSKGKIKVSPHEQENTQDTSGGF